MRLIQIGAFEAKTRFSELLRNVQRGAGYEILHRGRPVAKLVGDVDTSRDERIQHLLEHGRAVRSTSNITLDQILEWKAEGRR